MINSDFYEKLARIFCGDDIDLFTYKSGPDLVNFFNSNFASTDTMVKAFLQDGDM